MLDTKLCSLLSLLEIGHVACEYSECANDCNFSEIYQTDGLVQKLKFALPGETASAQQEEGFQTQTTKEGRQRSDLHFEMAAGDTAYPSDALRGAFGNKAKQCKKTEKWYVEKSLKNKAMKKRAFLKRMLSSPYLVYR